MANPLRGEAPIGASGYTLVLDFNAICGLRDYFGADMQTALDRILRGEIDEIDLRAVTWHLLRARHPALTLLQVGDLISDHPAEIAPAIQAAITRAWPEAPPEKKPPAPTRTMTRTPRRG